MFSFYRKALQPVFATATLGLMLLVMAACGGVGLTSASTLSDSLAISNHQMSYTFKTLDDQADPTFNQLLGINDHGEIAGYFGSGTVVNGTLHPNKGYRLYQPYKQSKYLNENFPGSVQTQVTAINNQGYTAGFWVDGNGNNFGFIKWHGVYTSYQNPNTGTGTVNQLLGLNDQGMAVGFYTDGNGVSHAYELNRKNGHFTSIVPPGSTSATATGINDNGDIVGFLTASNGNTVGFLLKGKKFTEFDFPKSTNTTPFGINQHDQIVGAYVDSAGKMHGFLLSNPLNHAHWQSIDDPNGIGTTTINGLNDNDQLVGFYVDSAGNTDGFLANPK